MILPRILLVGMTLVLGACASTNESKVDAPLVEDKYKLSVDRAAYEKLREEIPAEKRRENDEVAFVMQWMGEVKRPPGEVREKFNSALSKKRNLFQKDMEKRREAFVKKERKDREDFQREQTRQRENFVSMKRKPEERKEFFDDLDLRRKDFNAAQREFRDEFEAEIRDRRKNFEDYTREKTNEFNQEHRVYTKRYEDFRKEQEALKKKRDVAPLPPSEPAAE